MVCYSRRDLVKKREGEKERGKQKQSENRGCEKERIMKKGKKREKKRER